MNYLWNLIEWLQSEKMAVDLERMQMQDKIRNLEMFLIESVFWFEKVQELEKRPTCMEEQNNFDEFNIKIEKEKCIYNATMIIRERRFKANNNH